MPKSKEVIGEETWVFIGSHFDPSDHKLYRAYEMLDENEEIVGKGAGKLFYKNCHHMLGGVYKVETSTKNDHTSYMLQSATYLHTWADQEQIAAWRVTSLADETEDQLYKKIKKEKQVDHLAEFLLPLREQYKNRRGVHQIAFELAVLQALRKPIRG